MYDRFRKFIGIALALLVILSGGAAKAADENVSIVYFTKDISPAGLLKVYDKVNAGITGKVAIKLHTGEPKGPNLLPLPMIKALQAHIPNSNLAETNVYYSSPRQTTAGHRETIKTNGLDFCKVDIMDEFGAVVLPVRGGRHFKEMSMGKGIMDYDSMVVYTHFKGHTMGGFGGSMKNIAIGCADGKVGKAMIHAKEGAAVGADAGRLHGAHGRVREGDGRPFRQTYHLHQRDEEYVGRL